MAYSGPPGPPGYSVGPSVGHTRVSYRRAPNFLERIGGSMCGACVGCVLIVVACVVLFLNEGRSVHTYNMLIEARELCNPISSPHSVYESLNGKLVYVSGPLSTVGPVQDTMYAVGGQYVRLKRFVEMYQWIEETESREYKEPDGSIRTERHYKYNTMWRNSIINSNSFDDSRYHHNPSSMPVDDMEWNADKTTVGNYELSREAVLLLATWHPLRLSPEGKYKNGMKVYGNELYHGDPHRPEVGDIRVYYKYAGDANEGRPDTVSVVAKQVPGPLLKTYTTQSGHSVLFVYQDELSMDEVFDREHSSNNALTWFLRGLGWFLTVLAFNMIAGILTTLVDWIPLVRELVSLSVLLLSLLLGSSLSLAVMAIAWLRYRPLYSLTILLISLTPFIASRFFPRKENTETNKSY